MKKSFFRYTMITALIAFVGITAITVAGIHDELSENVVVSSSGIPKTWSKMPISSDAVVSLDASANDSLVQYTITISNTRSDSSLYLTNLASYLEETHGTNVGFLPLAENTVEYTYNPGDTDSWQALRISDPGNGRQDFRLNNNLEIGSTRSVNNTLYVRYQVAASLNEDILDDKVAVILNDGGSFNTIATASASVAVQSNDSAYPQVIAEESVGTPTREVFNELAEEPADSKVETIAANTDSVDSAYANPLGVHTSSTELQTLVSTAETVNSVDGDFVNATSMTLISILAVFSVAFIGYIVISRY